ncbi:hypothetical protein E2C01_096346 [Portunus trituberculatus]|uniref:RNase H type-1 domain-containing protein n=1 Tax=Portunus trituberculatus TaxID=210409 RepID=A0A5B7K803_PORTR|nr:hypothetical protein [Portunus trituberculatus]
MGSLTFAAQVTPLGPLWCRRLWWEGNRVFPRAAPHHLCPVPPHLHRLLRQWLSPGLLETAVPWKLSALQLQVYTDASDSGWGFQASNGRQGRERWEQADAQRHVNVRELTVPLLSPQKQADLRQLHVCFYMDNVVAVTCVKRMGYSRSISLLRTSEALFNLAASRHLTLSAVHRRR